MENKEIREHGAQDLFDMLIGTTVSAVILLGVFIVATIISLTM
ncbi:hypothetical protein [Staphylospora marina]|nr:hypothetical protein [Staphylospora marina]